MKIQTKFCLSCDTIFNIKLATDKFCSQHCAGTYNNKSRKKTKICIRCTNEVKTKGTATKYCSISCAAEARHEYYIERWHNGLENGLKTGITLTKHIVRFIWEKYEAKCARCGWCEKHPVDNKPPLHIEHIDGNYLNNKEENLILLCPNCHALTTTFGGRNFGNGRKLRKKPI